MAVFTDDIKNGLKLAHALKYAGAADAAQKMFAICVKSGAATASNVDALELFYGAGVYDRDFDVETAARYIYVAACAKKTIKVLESKAAANDDIAPWATPSYRTTDAVAKFFDWLKKPNRKPNIDDDKLFKNFCDAVNGGRAEMSDLPEDEEPLDLVKNIVGGRR